MSGLIDSFDLTLGNLYCGKNVKDLGRLSVETEQYSVCKWTSQHWFLKMSVNVGWFFQLIKIPSQ